MTSNVEAYQRIERLIADDQCVILDGGGATELQRVGLTDFRLSDKGLWGTWALYHAPYTALEVHRRYVATGCDIISTHTWAITSAPEMEARGMVGFTEPSHWMDRPAGNPAGTSGDCRSRQNWPMCGRL